MKNNRIFILLCIASILLTYGKTSADRVVLKNKNEIIGKIESSNEETIRLRVAFGSLTVRKDSIATIYRQSDIESEVSLIQEMLRLGAYDGALEEIAIAKKTFKKDTALKALHEKALIERAKIFLSKRQHSLARQDIKEARLIAPSNTKVENLFRILENQIEEGQRDLSAAYSALKEANPDKALKKFAHAVKSDPERFEEFRRSWAKAYFEAAELKFAKKKYTKAAIYYHMAASLDTALFEQLKSRWMESWMGLAASQINHDLYLNARDSILKLSEIEPRETLVLHLIGTLFYKLFEFREAYEYFALALGEDNPYSGRPEDVQLLEERLAARWEVQWKKLRNPPLNSHLLDIKTNEHEEIKTGPFVIEHNCEYAAKELAKSLLAHFQRTRTILDLFPSQPWGTTIGIIIGAKTIRPELSMAEELESRTDRPAKLSKKHALDFVMAVPLESYRRPYLYTRMLSRCIFRQWTDRQLNKPRLPEAFFEGIEQLADPEYMRNNSLITIYQRILAGEIKDPRDILDPDYFPERKEAVAQRRAKALAVVQFLLKSGGKQKFYRFCAATAHNKTLDALRQEYGINNWITFLQRWQKFLQEEIEEN